MYIYVFVCGCVHISLLICDFSSWTFNCLQCDYSQVIGNAAALAQSEDWAALIADAKERGCFVTMASSQVKKLLASQNISSALPSTKDARLF